MIAACLTTLVSFVAGGQLLVASSAKASGWSAVEGVSGSRVEIVVLIAADLILGTWIGTGVSTGRGAFVLLTSSHNIKCA